MPSIITVTPNPCIDISAAVPKLVADKKLRCTHLKKEPGGGGINVSRVITRLGGDTIAMYLAGGYTGDFLSEMLKNENVKTAVVKTRGHTRENFVMKEDSSGAQYKFGMPGPEVEEHEWKALLDMISKLPQTDYMVASGSLSPGMPADFYARVARLAKQKNYRLILDTAGEALQAALGEAVFMIKPNLGELASLSGVRELSHESAIKAAHTLIRQKQCEMVAVSMGAAGALLVSDSLSAHVPAPVTKIKSTVGAGDSMVAGLVLGLSGHMPLQKVLEYGVACGTATTMKEGTALCNPEDVRLLFATDQS
jgi:6-phosphofructokinase 2